MNLRLLSCVLLLFWLVLPSSIVLMIPQIVRAQNTIKMGTNKSNYNVGDEVVVYWDSSDPCIQTSGAAGQLGASGPYGLGPFPLSESELLAGYWDFGPAEQRDVGGWTITLTVSAPECKSSGSASFQVTPSECVSVQTSVATTSTTTASTRIMATITTTATTNNTKTIRSELTLPQMIATVAATATIVAAAYHVYMRHGLATLRITERRTSARPGLAFDVEVKSGVDREENPR